MTLAIIGTGNMAKGLATVFSGSGNAIVFGSRHPSEAASLASGFGGTVSAASIPDAVAKADIVFLAVPYDAAVAVVKAAGGLAGKIVVDLTNPMKADFSGLAIGFSTSAAEEIARLAPVLPATAGLGLPLSIDSLKAAVAGWAIERGAGIVNDVWGLQGDPQMAALVAARGVPVIVMHNRETVDPQGDIVADVLSFFARSIEIADAAGIARDKIVLDPGIGFGKTAEQSIACIARLGESQYSALSTWTCIRQRSGSSSPSGNQVRMDSCHSWRMRAGSRS